MDKQLIFDTAVKGILAQDALAKTDDDFCVYFDKTNGNRCGVGHLLTERQAKAWEKVSAKDNGICASSLLRENPLDLRKYGVDREVPSHRQFLDNLQSVHDNATSIVGFKADAKIFADNYELEFNHA